MARAGAGRSADAAAAAFLRGFSVGDRTAATYAANWAAFSRYCMRRGRCALPANTNTVVNFVGWQWRRGSVKAASLKPMLAAVRKAHLAAGYANACDDTRVREAKAGFRRADLQFRPSCERVRAPLPARLAWTLARRALDAPAARRQRLTALVCQFWWMRRSSDVARLAVGEVEARLDGSTHYVVPRHKTEAARGLLARSLPPPRPEDARPDGEPDLPHFLLQRLLGDLAHLPVSARLFTTCRAQVAAKLFSAWLLEELRLMGIVAPVGTFYASHSLKSGGATAANAAGVPRGAIAELSATTERTLAASYISALAPPTDYDRVFFGRLLPPSV